MNAPTDNRFCCVFFLAVLLAVCFCRPLQAELNLLREIELSRISTPGNESVLLTGEDYAEVPPEAWSQTTPWKFSLQNTKITKIGMELQRLRGLKAIELHNNPLKGLPDCFSALPFLREVLVFQCPIESLPPSLLRAESLIRLAIRDANFTVIPEDFSHLVRLEDLSLSSIVPGKVTTEPRTFPPTLEVLTLAGLGLNAVPEGLRQCRKLRFLDLGNNEITVLPAWVLEMPNLESLRLKGNPITAVEKPGAGTFALREVDLSATRLAEFPAGLSTVVMDSLDLSSTKISALPRTSESFPKVRSLRLNKTAVAAIPDWVADSSLERLDLFESKVPQTEIEAWRTRLQQKRKR